MIAKSPATPDLTQSFRLQLDFSAVDLTEDQFLKLCSDNPDLRMELTAKRELIVMPPTGGDTGTLNFRIVQRFGNWVDIDDTGVPFDSSTGFLLPNGAVRSPDISWVERARWEALTDAERAKCPPLCPDFVLELRSPSDRLGVAQDKMVEYLENGALLGWLIDPQNKRMYVYRPGQTVEMLEEPDTVSGDPVLPGFVLGLRELWQGTQRRGG
jgi:Uma2 family endonuclease